MSNATVSYIPHRSFHRRIRTITQDFKQSKTIKQTSFFSQTESKVLINGLDFNEWFMCFYYSQKKEIGNLTKKNELKKNRFVQYKLFRLCNVMFYTWLWFSNSSDLHNAILDNENRMEATHTTTKLFCQKVFVKN